MKQPPIKVTIKDEQGVGDALIKEGFVRDRVDEAKPEFFDKYYDLLHTGNWNARCVIERGRFNLDNLNTIDCEKK